MKTKSFHDYLKSRLNKTELAEIEQQAKFEVELLKSLQKDIATLVAKYMASQQIGFNELVRRLNISPTQASKIQRGEANLTLATIAHIFALLKMRPHFVVNHKK